MAESLTCKGRRFAVDSLTDGRRQIIDDSRSCQVAITYTLPAVAHVFLGQPEESGMKKGERFLLQHPPVHVQKGGDPLLGGLDAGEEFDERFLAQTMTVSSDGTTYSPPELPQIIEQVQGWGWEVGEELIEIVRLGQPASSSQHVPRLGFHTFYDAS